MSGDSHKIACVLVKGSGRTTSPNYFRNPSNEDGAWKHDRRFALLDQALKQAQESRCRILLLPAGFFVVKSNVERIRVANDVRRRLGRQAMVVAFGIDEDDRAGKGGDPKRPTKESAKNARLPYFGYAIELGKYIVHGVQQTGARPGAVSEEEAQKEIKRRVVRSRVLDCELALLLCGEVLSNSWRDAVAAESPMVILHPAHASVNLGNGRRGWGGSIGDLVKRLPRGGVHAFADHVAGLWHGQPLVKRHGLPASRRRGQECPTDSPWSGRMCMHIHEM